MAISVGTLNLNNLFSRYNFQAEVGLVPGEDAGGSRSGSSRALCARACIWSGWSTPRMPLRPLRLRGASWP